MIKEFLVRIMAYGYFTSFKITCEDSTKTIEDSIVDKLGEKSVKWDESGFYDKSRKMMTYEEVINDPRLIQTKSILGVELASGV
jgi:hypothetical protein